MGRGWRKLKMVVPSPMEGVPGGSVFLGQHYSMGADSGHLDLMGEGVRVRAAVCWGPES